MRRKLLIAALLIVLLGAGLYWGVIWAVEWVGRWGADDPVTLPPPPAPEAREAPRWPSREMPPYQWPPDFKLPLEITVENVPEVPEKLVGRSPPIEEPE